MIGTRTKAAEIVSTTLRDVGPQTDVYDGTFDISLADPTKPLRRERARSIGSVPDERTFLAIDTQQF